jgi:general secretion pathway protein E
MADALAAESSYDHYLDLRFLLDQLLADGHLTGDDAERVTLSPRGREEALLHPITFLASLEVADPSRVDKMHTSESLMLWLAQKAGQAYYRIDPLKIDVAAVTEVMSLAFARHHKILAVEVDAEEVVVVSAEPFIHDWVAGLEQVTRRRIVRALATPVDIARYTGEFYTLSQSISGATAQGASRGGSGLSNLEQMLELGSAQEPDANDQHIVSIVDWLLQYAFDQRASDIHLEPRRDIGRVRFRIDGVLHPIYELPAQVAAAVSSRIKILGRMDLAEKRRPQDGRLKTRRPNGSEVELRLSTLPTAFGEKLVMRVFDPQVLISGFGELGLANEDYSRWHQMVGSNNGIVLVTGPTGSGKTTTLYSTLKQLAEPTVNVCTIEDPIEMVEPAFNQMQVQSNIGLHFASGVRSLLRQDPDIIMIGEIRDMETAEMAIQAALTGHLVLSTLHTNDAPSAITRLLEVGVPPYLLKATVLGIMAQRLVRTLCTHCKRPVAVDASAWDQLVHPWSVVQPSHIMAAQGCAECRDTGYMGRQGIYEVLMMSEAVRQLIGDSSGAKAGNGNVAIDSLRVQAMKEGMRTLRLSGAQKVVRGETTIEEVMRVAPAPGNQ